MLLPADQENESTIEEPSNFVPNANRKDVRQKFTDYCKIGLPK